MRAPSYDLPAKRPALENKTSARSFLAEWPVGNATWKGWDTGNFTVVEITAKVVSQVSDATYSQGFRLINRNEDGRKQMYNFYLGGNYVGFGSYSAGPNTDSAKVLMDTTNAFHTYQLVLTDTEAYLYVDGAFAPSLTFAAGTSTYSRFEFGDFNTDDGGGEVLYKQIRWVENIPEPTTLTAFLTGVGVLLFRHRNRRDVHPRL